MNSDIKTMDGLSSPTSAERNAMHSIARLVAVPLAVAAVGVVIGYGIGRGTQTPSGDALLKEVFADIRPVSFSGKIAGIDPGKKQLTVTVEGTGGVKFPKIYQRKQFSLRPGAKILARRTKDVKTFEQEFERLKTTGKGPVRPPLPYTEQEIKIEELRVGEAVTVTVDVAAKATVLDSAFAAIQINVNR